MGQWTKVAETGDIPEDEGRTIAAGGKTLALFNRGGTFYAIDNTCAHRGGPLGEGELDGTTVICPWHGWRYDITTGAAAINPAIRVPCYPVKVEGTSVLVEL
jgi:nitrite reductase/ring-hydroxylating ferredoxin subunit